MMTELNHCKDKYTLPSGSLDYDLMYEDIVHYLQRIGKYDNVLEDSIVKNNIINQIKSICLISQKYTSNSEYNEIISEQCNYLRTNCFLSSNDIKIYHDFTTNLYNKCATISDCQIENYANDLNKIIDNSNLSQPTKDELSLSADLVINSSLYWQTNY